MIKGITTVFEHKKWVFAYAVMAFCFFKLDQAGMIQILSILIPFVIGANAFDKSKMIKDE